MSIKNYREKTLKYYDNNAKDYFDMSKNVDMSKYVSELFAEYGPFIDEGIVALDACTVVSRFVNVYVIEVEDKEWEERKSN